jgi:hypothetical protein
MGDFYGHNVAEFVPSFSWIDTLGKDLSAIPEAMQVEKDLNDGRISNDQIYTGVVNMVKDIPDDEFEKSFEMPKQTFLSYAKPAKNEKPDMYLARSAKLTEKGNKALIDKKGYKAYLDEITNRNAAYEEGIGGPVSEGMKPADAMAIQGLGNTKPPTPISPTEVTGIGIEHGVSADKMAPQVQAATEQQYKQQMGGFKEGQTQSQFLSGVSGIPTEPTREFSKTLQTDQQKASNKRLEDANRQRAEAAAERNKIARWRAAIQQGTATADQRREILDSQAKLEVKKLELQIRVKALQNILTEKAGKTDPGTYLPLISQEEEASAKQELALLMADMREWEDINTDYEGLLKEKGGTVTTRNTKSEPVKKSKFVIKSVK